MNVKYKLNLDVYKDRNYESIIVAQNDDKSRIIECKLYADSQPVALSSSVTAAFNATVDNVIVAENVPCIVADNAIKITLAKSMLQLAGMMKCELVLSENDTILTTQHFSVFVNKSVINTKSKYEPAGANLATKKDVNSAIKTASAKMIAKDSLLNTSTSINLTSLEDTEQTANGVTIAVRNNKISLSGTSTAAVNFYLKLKRAVTLEQGKAYCLSLQNFANITNSGCVFYPANSQTVISSSWLLSEVSAFKNAAATYTATENVVVNSIKIAVAANRLIDNSCNLQLEQNNKKSAYANPDFISESIKPELYQTPDYTMHYLYVSNDYNESTEGFGVTKFN